MRGSQGLPGALWVTAAPHTCGDQKRSVRAAFRSGRQEPRQVVVRERFLRQEVNGNADLLTFDFIETLRIPEDQPEQEMRLERDVLRLGSLSTRLLVGEARFWVKGLKRNPPDPITEF